MQQDVNHTMSSESKIDHQDPPTLAVHQIERYRKIVLSRTQGKPLSSRALVLISLMVRELGRVSGSLLKKNRKALAENLHHLVVCILLLASLYNIPLRVHPGDLGDDKNS